MAKEFTEENCGPMREKYWTELTDGEKLERLGKAFLQVLQENHTLRANLDKLQKMFTDHSHSNVGTTLVKPDVYPTYYEAHRKDIWLSKMFTTPDQDPKQKDQP